MATYKELDPYGRETPQGDAREGLNDDAISNLLAFFLSTKSGVFINEPEKGGMFQNLLFRSLSPLSGEQISSYASQIQKRFSRILELDSLTIEPDIVNRAWEVTVKWRSLLTKEFQETDIILFADQSPSYQKFDLIGIPDIGETLFYFILAEQPSMSTVYLEYNTSSEQWEWGKYVFTNFSESDPYYTQIINYIGAP